MIDVLIVGHGPAGVSAGLYAVRAGMETALVGKDGGALAKAERIENFYGLTSPVSGPQLVETGIKQAERLGARIISEEVVGLRLDEYFTVETTASTYEARAVILATGAARTAPPIEGITEFEGRGVSYCAVCDAFFYRGKDVAVLGDAAYALHEVCDLQPVVRSVTVLTNGHPPAVSFPNNITIVTATVAALTGGQMLESVRFENGDTLPVSGLFVAVGVAGSTALAKKIGAVVMGDRIVADANMRTSVPGLWAAGDCTGGMKQIAKAVYEGAQAGTDAVKYLRSE